MFSLQMEHPPAPLHKGEKLSGNPYYSVVRKPLKNKISEKIPKKFW